MSDVWNGFRDLFVSALEVLHSLLSFMGDPAWGWAVIGLTIVVRIILLPLAVKQTRSMRAMQALQPKIKAIQKKYKADRELLRKDPELYKAKRQKMNEELTALYKESGVNPAGGCLPLLAQAPIFIALFSVLRTPLDSTEPGTTLYNLLHAKFYVLTPGTANLSTPANQIGAAGIVLIVLMAASMFYSQRQMMARTAGADPSQQQQQKIMMFVMPVFLAFISFGFPMGVLLYWVTTNIWQIGQQAVILREVEHDPHRGSGGATAGGSGGSGPSGGGPDRETGKSKGEARAKKPSAKNPPPTSDGKKTSRNGDHLPSRRSKRDRT